MIFWVALSRIVSLAFIVFGTIVMAKSQRSTMKYTGTFALISGLGVTIVPILRVFGGWTVSSVIFLVLALIGITIVLLFKVRNRYAKYAGITVLLLLVVIGGPAWIYEGLRAPSDELYSQLEQVIRNHDNSKVQELAADRATENFLLGLPADAKVDASDFQGGGPVGNGFSIGYFPARIGGHAVNTYMVTKTGFQLIPHWKLIEVSTSTLPSIKNVKVNPSWLQN